MEKERTLESPIFALYPMDEYVIVASGGGNEKFGVKNKLLSYKLSSSGISDKVHEIEMGNNIPMFITGIPNKKIFCTCVNNYTYFYSLSPSGTFEKINELQVLPQSTEDIFQSCLSINEEYLSAGTSTGSLKLYNIKIKEKNLIETKFLIENNNAHLRIINNQVIIPNKKILITASGDGTCKIFETSNLKMLNKISFRASMDESTNYFMRDLAYDSYNNVLYTLQTPLRGKSFVSKWNLSKNLEPIASVEVDKTVCFSLDYNGNNVIGVTESEGNVIFVDTRKNMGIIKRINLGENMIKCGKFWRGKFITGSVDNKLRMRGVPGNLLGGIWVLFRIAIIAVFVLRIMKYKRENENDVNL